MFILFLQFNKVLKTYVFVYIIIIMVMFVSNLSPWEKAVQVPSTVSPHLPGSDSVHCL